MFHQKNQSLLLLLPIVAAIREREREIFNELKAPVMIILVFFIAPYINLNQLNPKLDPYEFNRTILLSNF